MPRPNQVPAAFISRVLQLNEGGSLFGVQVFTGDVKDTANPTAWENVFMGTQDECMTYAANLHHGIEPNMLENFDPAKDVKRKIEYN